MRPLARTIASTMILRREFMRDRATVVIPAFELARHQLQTAYLRVYPDSSGFDLWQWCDIVSAEFERTSIRRQQELRQKLLSHFRSKQP